MEPIYIFGDSIMKGVVYNVDKDKYQINSEMPKELEESLKAPIVNKSTFGYTIKNGIMRIEQFLGMKNAQTKRAVIEYGGNDCDFNWSEVAQSPESEHLPKTTLEEYKQTYAQILTKLKASGINPIVMTLPPINAEKYFKKIVETGNLCGENIIKWLGDVQMIYRFQELYSNTAAAVARGMNCIVADVRSYFLDKHNFSELLCEDGIHPNENGHRLICTAISETVCLAN